MKTVKLTAAQALATRGTCSRHGRRCLQGRRHRRAGGGARSRARCREADDHRDHTDHYLSTESGGTWWDVAVPEVSEREQVRAARKDCERERQAQRAE
jgi:hypothetical protein